MKKQWLYYIGGVLIGAGLLRYAYKNYVLATEWDYEVVGTKIAKLSPLEFSFSFILKNKSAVKAKIKNLDIRIFTGSAEIAKIYQPQVQEIIGGGNTMITVSAKAIPEEIKKNILGIIGTALQKKDIPLDFIGTMQLSTPFGWMKLPIRYSSTGKELYKLYNEYY